MIFKKIKKYFKEKKENNEIIESHKVYMMGLIYSTKGMTETALDYFNQALELNPNNTGALGSKGDALLSLGKPKEALKVYDKVLSLNPKDKLVLINKGHVLRELGKYEESIGYFIDSLNIQLENVDNESLNVEAFMGIGSSFKRLKKHKEAVSAYDALLKIQPGNTDALINKATSLIGIGRDNEALECVNEILKINPKDNDALLIKKDIQKGFSNIKEGNFFTKKVIKDRLSQNKNDIEALTFKGDTLKLEGKTEEAKKYYKKALKLVKNDLSKIPIFSSIGYAGKGFELLNQNKAVEAIKLFDCALRVEPENVNVITYKGAALANLGKFKEALKYFEKALEINPNYECAKENIKKILKDLKRIKHVKNE